MRRARPRAWGRGRPEGDWVARSPFFLCCPGIGWRCGMKPLLMAPPQGQPQANAWMQLVPLVAIFVIFYFLLIRPARKRQKDVQKMLDELKSGDKVITSGGLLGTVMAIDRDI